VYRYVFSLLILATFIFRPSRATTELVEYTIIVTGDELLQGKYLDSHTQSITRTLAPLGFRCISSTTVGDRADDLLRALHYASRRSSLILVTGGLGPTKDDITRTVLSEFTGIPLQEDTEVVSQLERRFSVKPGKLPDNIRRQGLTPESGDYLPNHHGSAVGLIFDKNNQVVVALPGPPSELKPMLGDQLLPFLSKRFGTRPPGSSLQMRFVGIGESSIDRVIENHLVLPEGLIISSLFEEGRVDVTFSLPGNQTDCLEVLERELKEQIGEFMYSDDGSTLEECVVEMLVEKGLTLGLAEVGTGGALFASLNDLESSSRILKGGFTAASDARMASIIAADKGLLPDYSRIKHLCRMLDSSWGLVIGEPKVAADGSRSVRVLIGSEEKLILREQIPLRGGGDPMRRWLVTTVLDLLRRSLLK
jgi:nicotinamide-nucleotide amidase